VFLNNWNNTMLQEQPADTPAHDARMTP